jgi:hypothetical protein
VTDLDSRARAATTELLERSTPDVSGCYAELRRIRTRRTTAKIVTAAAAVTLVVGGWQAIGGHRDRIEPAPPPPRVTNGVLMAPVFRSSGESAGTWGTALGDPPGLLPTDVDQYSPLQFTTDGTGIVYANEQGLFTVWNLSDGSTQTIVRCPDGICADAAVSPDLGTVAFQAPGGIRLLSAGTGEATPVDAPGVNFTGPPAWSPDGRRLAFTTRKGVFTVDASGHDLTEVWSLGYPRSVMLDVAWSPDGKRLAFFDTSLVPLDGRSVTSFMAMVVGADGSNPTALHVAGNCGCVNGPLPWLTWSPDGSLIAVATATLPSGGGMYTVRPDGTDWTLVKAGYFGQPAWQPVID